VERLVEDLLKPEAYPEAVDAVELVETPISSFFSLENTPTK
jgi:hypothetical protein